MTTPASAYRHHPNLRDKIVDPKDSYFRKMDLAEIDAHVAKAGFPPDWRHSCDAREAMRRELLEGRRDRDLWVFGYGSLMWDPGFHFTEVRRAHTDDHARQFSLWDEGGRGSPDAPGLMLALDHGPGCTGLAFRIPVDLIEEETFIVCRRELLADPYLGAFIPLQTDHGPVEALTFVANHASNWIVSDVPVDMQAPMIAFAEGFLGRNRDYLDSLIDHMDGLGIDDPAMRDLHAQVETIRRPEGGAES